MTGHPYIRDQFIGKDFGEPLPQEGRARWAGREVPATGVVVQESPDLINPQDHPVIETYATRLTRAALGTAAVLTAGVAGAMAADQLIEGYNISQDTEMSLKMLGFAVLSGITLRPIKKILSRKSTATTTI